MHFHSNLVADHPFKKNCSLSEGTSPRCFGGDGTQARAMKWYGQGATGNTVQWSPSTGWKYWSLVPPEASTPGQPGSLGACAESWSGNSGGGWKPQQLFFPWPLPVATPGSQRVEPCWEHCPAPLSSSAWGMSQPASLGGQRWPFRTNRGGSLCPAPWSQVLKNANLLPLSR